ncbi:MAG: endonuclease MutS2 [Lachnospiraceae bacterium]|nr:endonuclease MutS2 [Lachnospiraceae bacterium]
MNEKVLRTLEYTKIIDRLAEKAGSELGISLCRNLAPMTVFSDITKAQQETSDALGRLLRKGATSFGNNHDIGWAMKSLDKGSTISIPELLKVAGLLENVNRIKQYGRPGRNDENPDSLTGYFDTLEPLTPVSTEIRRCIIGEDFIADDASTALRNIRRSMSQTSQKIQTQLNSMVNGSVRTYLQDTVITLRNNRYCIPVKSEYKNQVSGMVHDQSSSGSTFFIEPTAVVNLNNQLRELELKEQEEIEIILAVLSAQVGEHTEVISMNQRLMTELDFIFAKAALALEQNATMPVMNENHIINIRKGRHPLLKVDQVVPIDIHLGRDFDLLVITGPNTGGKTVSLKTVGLFTLMGQAGLHIPAADRSELAIFHEVFADIGDEQSIEQSLSTFSSHMTTIVNILENADRDSLCLFDELGAGTDPTEGAALAIAILSYLHKGKILSIATTHYSELKLYALSTESVQNASCEFDVETLKPTYRLLIGIPGKSNAFAISSKLGLPDFIINHAREQINTDEISFEDVISDLEKSRVMMEREQLEIAANKDEIKALKERLKAKNEKFENNRDRILREAQEEARDILVEAKDFADLTIRTLQKAGISDGMKELEQARDSLRQQIKDKNDNLKFKAVGDNEQKIDADEIKIGANVKIVSMGLTGSVNSLPDQKGNVFVQCGAMRTNANINDLVLVSETLDKQAEKTIAPKSGGKAWTNKAGKTGNVLSSGGSMDLSKATSISYEISLRGKTVDEALSQLDKYLDDAYLSHLPSVRVVHGKGTGTLRKAVHGFLKKLSYVDSFRLGEYGEGDSGVTVVNFRS